MSSDCGHWPAKASASAHRSLVLLDLRGTGESAMPTDPASHRCDRQVDDVEAQYAHLGLMGRSG